MFFDKTRSNQGGSSSVAHNFNQNQAAVPAEDTTYISRKISQDGQGIYYEKILDTEVMKNDYEPEKPRDNARAEPVQTVGSH